MPTFSLQGNWIDLVIILILFYFLSDSWRVGFWVILCDFLGFSLSLTAAFFGFSFLSSLIQESFSLSRSFSNALGFFFVAAISEAILNYLFTKIIKKIPDRFWKKPWNNILAIIPSLGQGIVFVSFFLTLTMSLPVLPKLKSDISNSKMGGAILGKATGVEVRINEIFGGLINDSLTYLTVKPDSKESIPIFSEDLTLLVDDLSEKEMIRLINEERVKRGVKELKVRNDLIPVARSHAEDMWTRNYFGHYSPEGESVGDRLDNAEISYSFAGENLALAPTVQTAHVGLMNSEGHKENILDPEFGSVGVGVIDNGVYGKMFVQIFTD